jgi:hypothetical protein
MYYDDARPHPSDSEDSDAPEFKHRLGTVFVELWHDWFEALSEVAYQTHRAWIFRFPILARSVRGNERFDRHGQTQRVLAIDGPDGGSSSHACRSAGPSHGSHAETTKIARQGGRRGPLVEE